MYEKNVSTKQLEKEKDPRLPSKNADESRRRGHQAPTSQGPETAFGLRNMVCLS